MAEAFPLAWPTGYPRTDNWKRSKARFGTFSFAQARDSLMDELRRLGGRGMERWGCSDMLNRAFTGFTALPAPQAEQPWHEVLGVDPRDSIAVIETMYKAKMKRAHPDLGGSVAQSQALNKAIELARQAKQS